MKYKYKIPSEYRVTRFILVAFALIVAGSRIQKWVLEQQIQRRFEQPFAAFDHENMEFTIFYGPACAGEDYEISSVQATPELRQAAKNFVRNLKMVCPLMKTAEKCNIKSIWEEIFLGYNIVYLPATSSMLG
ncbi:MAG: hypothetical protein HFE80_07095 [Clostridiaceae bacterium]|jgi:hypothetical protein|nr:hypothetical protein [Clostridiaceae bacterium]